jgi:hypothetical protein
MQSGRICMCMPELSFQADILTDPDDQSTWPSIRTSNLSDVVNESVPKMASQIGSRGTCPLTFTWAKHASLRLLLTFTSFSTSLN